MGCCSGKKEETKRIVYACAGCSDVGEVSDLVSRKLRKEGYAQPTASCLAGIGAKIDSFINAAKTVDEIITVDGCGVACAKKIIENIGITPKAFILTDWGLEKGNTPVTETLISDLSTRIQNA